LPPKSRGRKIGGFWDVKEEWEGPTLGVVPSEDRTPGIIKLRINLGKKGGESEPKLITCPTADRAAVKGWG